MDSEADPGPGDQVVLTTSLLASLVDSMVIVGPIVSTAAVKSAGETSDRGHDRGPNLAACYFPLSGCVLTCSG